MNKSKKDKKIIFEINVNNFQKLKNWENKFDDVMKRNKNRGICYAR